MVEEIDYPEKGNQTAASHWQILSYTVVSSTPLPLGRNHTDNFRRMGMLYYVKHFMVNLIGQILNAVCAKNFFSY